MLASQLTLRNVGEIIWAVLAPWIWIVGPIAILGAACVVWLVWMAKRRS